MDSQSICDVEVVCLSKKFGLVLISLLVVLGLLLIEPCIAPVSTPANSVDAPEIVSVEIHSEPIWCSPTYYTNPYTGEVTETTPGYWAPNGSIDITIKNRSFNQYTDKNGNYINTYYCIFWRKYSESTHPSDSWWWKIPKYAKYQSDSDYTVITLKYSSDGSNHDQDHLEIKWYNVMDFRIQAVTGGYFNRDPAVSGQTTYGWTLEGEGSESTEFTITIPYAEKPDTSNPDIHLPSNSSSTSNIPSYLQNLQQFALLAIIVFVCVIAGLLVVIAYLLKQRKSLPSDAEVVFFGEVEM
jgi:hypothetical protein